MAQMKANLKWGVAQLIVAVSISASSLIFRVWAQEPTGASISDPSDQTEQLRITNSGKFDIEGIWVVFPNDEIEFASIPAGITSDYVDVPRGVYGDMRFRLILDGGLYTQYRIDSPMALQQIEGSKFTIELALVESRRNVFQGRFGVQFLALKRDQ